jgi:hypothetical protein
MMAQTHTRILAAFAVAVVGMAFAAAEANALPTFARQTGLACSACHTLFPELGSFGRAFKLHGYTTLSMKDSLEEKETDKTPELSINRTFPLSVMLQTSFTRTDQKQPGTQNGDFEFPQQLSIFLAGEITPHIGTFLQATYNGQDDHFALDNTDIRFANDAVISGKELVYGVTFNNNPTVEDLWNTTPAWGYPFAAADSAPEPAAGALLDGVLAQQVAGLGGYFMWDKHLYADVTLYRSAQIGSPQPPTGMAGNTVRDVAPYWRLAWQQNLGHNYLEVGTLGMWAQLFPDSVSGPTNKITDVGFDTQYERPFGADAISAHAIYIYENQQLNATQAANHSDKLHTFRLDGIYHLRSRLAFALGYFLIRGSNDSVLYAKPDITPGAPLPVTGSVNGSPDSDGVRAEISYYPWQNVRFSAQYTAYTEFNGRSNDYNGTGRDASGNNTLYILAWLNY